MDTEDRLLSQFVDCDSVGTIPNSPMSDVPVRHTSRKRKSSDPNVKQDKVTCWCFTLNNYKEADWQKFKDLNKEPLVKWGICAKEVGESGTPHLQGYLFLAKQKPLSFVKSLFYDAHWENAKGHHGHNYQYIALGLQDGKQKKDVPEPENLWELGNRPSFKNNGEREKVRWHDIASLALLLYAHRFQKVGLLLPG